MNKVHLVGRLANGPWNFTTSSGKAGSTFILAVSRTVKDKDGRHSADFPKVTVWGKQAETCLKYLAQCEFIGVDASIRTSTEEKDGKTVYNMMLSADNVSFLGFKKKADEGIPEPNIEPPYKEFGDYAGNVSDVPF